MKDFLHNLDGKFKIAGLSIFILALFGIIALTINIDEKQLVNVSMVIIGILILTLIVLFNKTKNTIRYYSLAIVVITVLIVTAQKTFIQKVFESFLSTYFPQYLDKSSLVEASPFLTQISVMIFVLIALFIVNYFMQDNTAMGIAKDSIDDLVPESSIKEKMQRVIHALNDDLRSIDIKTNWSIHNFVPLDAEVEVSTGNKKQRRITNLLNAIQKSDDRLFLVLGDPGSGKSVSLRKLARELAEESDKTGKIPIYINLKEWLIEDTTKIPTTEDIKSFVISNILNRDIAVTKFFSKYFDRLYEEGRLYFIFDSFDEIPMLLNESENSELIQHYSEIFFRFLKGARAESSQGVLASRIFRKPTRDFQVNTTLELRPFDDEKIMKMFTNLGSFSKKLQIELFRERHDLVPIARNPFTAQLISDYTEKNNDALPKNQAEMYKSYIISTLENCDDKIKRANLTVERIFQLSIDIAQLMFDEHGFEISKSKLIKHFDRDEIENVINILKFSRLGRVGNDESNFSFVHRRFAEYFIVEKMIENEENDIDYKSIPEDSKWRDALVLYCEVASFQKVQEIANFCWKTIDDINNPKDLRVIHTVRFLRDAFKGRKECLVNFEEELAKYIEKQVDKVNDTIQIKLAVECVGLLKMEYMDKIIVKALNFNNYWMSDTALKSCRHVDMISKGLIVGLKQYIFHLPIKVFLKNKKNLEFSLLLSSAFTPVYKFFRIYVYFLINIIFLLLSVIVLGIEYSYIDLKLVNTLFLFLFFTHMFYMVRSPIKSNIRQNSFFEFKIILFLLVQGFSIFTVITPIIQDYGVEKVVENSEKLILPNSFYLILIYMLISLILFSLLQVNKRYSSDFFKSLLEGIVVFIFRVISWKKEIFSILLILLSSIPTYFIFKYILYNFVYIQTILSVSNWFYMVIMILGPISWLAIATKSGYSLLKDYTLLRKIYTERLSTRKKIQFYYEKFNDTSVKIKYLEYINSNYFEIKGEWSSSDILKVSENKADIYLAQLEEKWRGIEK